MKKRTAAKVKKSKASWVASPLGVSLLALLSLFLVNRLSARGESSPGVLLTFAILTSSLLITDLGIRRASGTFRWGFDWNTLKALYFAAALYSIAWGPFVFLGHYVHDEWGYFVSLNQNLFSNLALLVAPLNEHFVPSLRLFHWMMAALFGGQYFPLALVMHLLVLALLAVIVRLLRKAGVSELGAASGVGYAVVFLLKPGVFFWKAGGLSLIGSIAGFLVFIALTIPTGQTATPPNARERLFLSMILLFTVTFSSLLTFPFLFGTLPLIMETDRALRRRLGYFIGLAFTISIAYFVARNLIFHIPFPPQGQLSATVFLSLLGEFLMAVVYPKLPTPGWLTVVLGGAFCVLPVGWCLLRRRKQFSQRSILLMTSWLVLMVSIAQLYRGRGAIRFSADEGRYYLLPSLMMGLLLAGAVNWLVTRYQARLSMKACLLIFLGLPTYKAIEHSVRPFHLEWLHQAAATQKAQSEFFASAHRMFCSLGDTFASSHVREPKLVYLPNLSLESRTAAKELKLSPPFDLPRYGYDLEYFARIANSSCYNAALIRFEALDRMPLPELSEVFRLPAVREFYQTYFGLIPAGF